MVKLIIIFLSIFLTFEITYADELRSDDKTILKALERAKAKEFSAAYTLAKNSPSPAFTRSLVRLNEILSIKSSLDEVLIFHEANQWIPICAFQNDIERKITPDDSDISLNKWFNICPPKSEIANLLYEYNRISLAHIKLTKDFLLHWAEITKLSPNLDETIFNKFKSNIPKALIAKKVDNLLWEGNVALSTAYTKYLSKSEQLSNKLRINYANESLTYEVILKKYPNLKNDEYIKYKQISRLLKRDKDNEAYKQYILVKNMNHFEQWWKIKHVLIRNFIKEKQYLAAYKLSLNHRLDNGENYQDAEWIAGWVALRFLNNPKAAINHFYRAFTNAKYSTSQSKYAYWLGRCFKEINNKEKTEKWFGIASQHTSHFYGQLAHFEYTSAPNIDLFGKTPVQHFNVNSIDPNIQKIVYAVYLMEKSKNRHIAINLLKSLSDRKSDDQTKYFVINYLQKKQLIPLTVKATKYLANSGGGNFLQGYPTTVKIENHNNSKSLYLSIIRQESNFDPSAESCAGAFGLMQLMPSTAKRFAKILKLAPNAFRHNPDANIAKGVYYLDSLVDQFGTMIVAIAAYNAGEGAVGKWLTRYGNPAKLTDQYCLIDWIESIPYSETRLYVKKVLENMLVYEKILKPQQPQDAFLATYLGK